MLCNCHIELGDFQRAKSALRDIIEHKFQLAIPEYAYCKYIQGRILYEEKNIDSARVAFEKAFHLCLAFPRKDLHLIKMSSLRIGAASANADESAYFFNFSNSIFFQSRIHD